MAVEKVSVDQILKYVDKLSNQEKSELTQKIINFTNFSKKESEEDKSIQILIKKGILKEKDAGIGYFTGSFKPIKLKGKQISETVIENRG